MSPFLGVVEAMTLVWFSGPMNVAEAFAAVAITPLAASRPAVAVTIAAKAAPDLRVGLMSIKLPPCDMLPDGVRARGPAGLAINWAGVRGGRGEDTGPFWMMGDRSGGDGQLSRRGRSPSTPPWRAAPGLGGRAS